MSTFLSKLVPADEGERLLVTHNRLFKHDLLQQQKKRRKKKNERPSSQVIGSKT